MRGLVLVRSDNLNFITTFHSSGLF